MAELIKNIPEKFKEYWSKQTKKKKTLTIILFAAVIILCAVIIYFLNRPEYAVLYSGLSDSEAGEIYRKLTESDYDVKVGDNGVLYVLKKDEHKIRLELAAEGYPKSGLNYDIFSKSSGFGTTQYEKRKYMQFQLQDRLQDTIKSIDLISDAVVTLNIPDNDSVVLKGDKKPTTASVLIKTKNNVKLAREQVDAIVALVSKSVEGLEEENVTVIDQNMTILNKSNSTDPVYPGTQYDLQNQVATKLEEQILNMLEPIFGFGKIVTGVNVRLNFDRQTTESIRFEPVIGDDGIIISLTELIEIRKKIGEDGGGVGQDPNGGAPGYVDPDDESIDYHKISRTVNYEVNQIIERLEKAQGQIEDLTVSVVIDSSDANEEVLANVRQIVANAVGVDAKYVEVSSMEFTGKKSFEAMFEESRRMQEELLRKQRERTMTIVIVIASMVVLLALVFFVSMAARRASERRRQQQEELMKFYEEQARRQTEEANNTIDFDIFDEHKTDYRDAITKFFRKNPEIFIQLIRNWLNEE